MNHTPRPHTRQGSTIVITLVLLLVMTTMGVGLYYSTKQTVKQVAISGNRSEALYSAETCVLEAVQWLEVEAADGIPPCQDSGSSACKTITANMGHVDWALSGETSVQKNRMNAQNYTCNISLLSAAPLKILYKIRSQANGANNVDSTIEVIVSTIISSGKVTYESWRELF